MTDSDEISTIRGCNLDLTSHLTDMGYTGDAAMECTEDMQQDEVCFDLMEDGNEVNICTGGWEISLRVTISYDELTRCLLFV